MENFSSKIKQVILKFLIPLVALLAIAAAVYFYKQLEMLKQDPQILTQQEIEVWVRKVGKILVLPEGETPTIVTVTDPEALRKDQPFFEKAQIGDKVLIYTSAKKAILYSVSLAKILEIAPLNIGSQNAATPAPAPTPSSNTTQ